ncbi:MAG: UbiA family prenyltransferase [Burkholderiaceae bacterium]|nr:UbiA family prenyltransferase [Burkholderiaceae bacterium]
MNGDDRSIPLYVDLDGCLLRTDTLWESFAAALRANPFAGLLALFALLQGRAALKRRLAAIGQTDVATMPRNERFVGWLRGQRARGRRVVLATAADAALAAEAAQAAQDAEAVETARGDPVDPLFDAVLASDGRRNLKGPNKLAAIREHAGDAPFDYCGNGPEDVAIFAQARRAIVVGASPRVLAAARRESTVLEVFDARPPWPARARAFLRAMRPHQWLKNLLVLVPLLTSFRVDEMPALLDAALAFVSFSLAASSGYLLNDLLDLSADRRHPRKRLRPFAAGELSVRSGFAAAALLFVVSIAIAFAVGNTFIGWVLAYLVMTGAYSGFAKRIALLDVAALAGLYTVRVLAGGAAIGVEVSFWLLAFSVFLFFSLALVKRCGEIVAQLERDEATVGGRGYRVGDLPVLQALGIAASFAALVVLALYVQTSEVTERYASPQLLWLMLVGLLILLGRMWLSTARGEMHDDPLVHAIEDRASRWIVGALLVLFAAAATLRLPF